MTKRYTDELIIGFLKQAAAGAPIKKLCRKHRFSDASFYIWRQKFGGLDVPDAKRASVAAMRAKTPISERRACQLLGLARSVLAYESQRHSRPRSGTKDSQNPPRAISSPIRTLRNSRWP